MSILGILEWLHVFAMCNSTPLISKFYLCPIDILRLCFWSLCPRILGPIVRPQHSFLPPGVNWINSQRFSSVRNVQQENTVSWISTCIPSFSNASLARCINKILSPVPNTNISETVNKVMYLGTWFRRNHIKYPPCVRSNIQNARLWNFDLRTPEEVLAV